MNEGDLENLILSTIERWSTGRNSERHGMVTSYDPKKHLAKVTYQPGGQESGWLPIETGHIGNGYGMAVGLTTGDGKKTGDQVVIHHQEGDFESGKIVQRVHSNDQKPPEVQSGEMVIWTKFKKSGGGDEAADGGQEGQGQKIFLKKDGSISFEDGSGASITFDGKGGIAVKGKSLSEDITGARTTKIGGGDTVSIGGDKTASIGGKRDDKVSGNWQAQATFGNWPWLQDDDG